MQICLPHWDALRQQIISKGMGHLISKDGKEAAKLLVDYSPVKTSGHYDPLLCANMLIWENALKVGGTYLMGEKEDGSQYCPLCELDLHAKPCSCTDCVTHSRKPSDVWLDNCTDGQLQVCIEKGLVAKPS